LTAQVFNGATLLASGSYARLGNNNLDTTFQHYILNFNSAGGATRVAFKVDAPTFAIDGFLDNVAVSGPPIASVPEPASWALMIAGFGIVGGAMRNANRQRKQRVQMSYA
jgi:PEP-CTERM motif